MSPPEEEPALFRLLTRGVRPVALMLTTGCNLACRYCAQRRGTPRTLPEPLLDAAVERLFPRSAAPFRLDLYGGEPLLALPLVRRAVARVRELGALRPRPTIRVVTNGTLLDAETLRFLVDAGVELSISFDGLPPAQDDRAEGSFDLLDGVLARLSREAPRFLETRLGVKMTLTSRNVAHLEGSFRYFLSRGVRDVEAGPLVTHDPGWDLAARAELDRQLGGVARASRELRAVSGRIPFSAFRPRARAAGPGDLPGVLCGAGRRGSLFVDVDGWISPCAAMAASILPNPPPLAREAMERLGGCHLLDPDLDAKLEAREKAAADVPLLARTPGRSSSRGPCDGCEARDDCFACPLSSAFAPGEPDPERIPSLPCDFAFLTSRHRRAFLASRPEPEAQAGRNATVTVSSTLTGLPPFVAGL